MENEQTQLKLEDLKPIEAKGVDFSEFEGNKALIEKAGVIEVNSYYNEEGKKVKEPRKVLALKVESRVITSLTNAEGKTVEVRASELFNLIKDKDGKIGWSKAPKAKLNNFLKKFGVKHPVDLIGKTAVIRLRKKENPDGSESEFLGFIL